MYVSRLINRLRNFTLISRLFYQEMRKIGRMTKLFARGVNKYRMSNVCIKYDICIRSEHINSFVIYTNITICTYNEE